MVVGLSVYTSFPEYDAELYNVSNTEVFECLTSEEYAGHELEQEMFYTSCLHVHTYSV
jgi:hypothetical protein